jgi:hypothetical protein
MSIAGVVLLSGAEPATGVGGREIAVGVTIFYAIIAAKSKQQID